MTSLGAAMADRRPRRAGLWRRALRRLLRWNDRRRERRLLAAMSERELRDLSLNRLDVLRELRKPFWRL